MTSVGLQILDLFWFPKEVYEKEPTNEWFRSSGTIFYFVQFEGQITGRSPLGLASNCFVLGPLLVIYNNTS